MDDDSGKNGSGDDGDIDYDSDSGMDGIERERERGGGGGRLIPEAGGMASPSVGTIEWPLLVLASPLQT